MPAKIRQANKAFVEYDGILINVFIFTVLSTYETGLR